MYGVGITNNGFIGFHTNNIASVIGDFLILYGTRSKKSGSRNSAVIHFVIIEYPTGTIMRKVIESIETIIYISIYLSEAFPFTYNVVVTRSIGISVPARVEEQGLLIAKLLYCILVERNIKRSRK